eukprot:RCo042691
MNGWRLPAALRHGQAFPKDEGHPPRHPQPAHVELGAGHFGPGLREVRRLELRQLPADHRQAVVHPRRKDVFHDDGPSHVQSLPRAEAVRPSTPQRQHKLVLSHELVVRGASQGAVQGRAHGEVEGTRQGLQDGQSGLAPRLKCNLEPPREEHGFGDLPAALVAGDDTGEFKCRNLQPSGANAQRKGHQLGVPHVNRDIHREELQQQRVVQKLHEKLWVVLAVVNQEEVGADLALPQCLHQEVVIGLATAAVVVKVAHTPENQRAVTHFGGVEGILHVGRILAPLLHSHVGEGLPDMVSQVLEGVSVDEGKAFGLHGRRERVGVHQLGLQELLKADPLVRKLEVLRPQAQRPRVRLPLHPSARRILHLQQGVAPQVLQPVHQGAQARLSGQPGI